MSDDLLQAEILAALEPGDEHPDPERVAEALCIHCTFPVVRRRVPTGRRFFGPFWRTAWVHTNNGEVRCWSPNAAPDRRPASADPKGTR